jgi:hypothetical protein
VELQDAAAHGVGVHEFQWMVARRRAVEKLKARADDNGEHQQPEFIQKACESSERTSVGLPSTNMSPLPSRHSCVTCPAGSELIIETLVCALPLNVADTT